MSETIFTADDFVKAFGKDGALWFVEGKPFAEATALSNDLRTKEFAEKAVAMQRELAALRDEIGELERRLAAAPQGNPTPVPPDPVYKIEDDGGGRKIPKAAGYDDGKVFGDGSGMARFREGIVLPSDTSPASAVVRVSPRSR